MKKTLSLLIVVFLTLASCRQKETRQASAPYIVTTTGMIADLAGNIAPGSYRVEALMGPGVDPHLYKASQGDIRKLADADIILYNGLHLEGKMTDILEKMGRSKSVVAVSSGLDHELLIPLEGASAAHDPHIWFDVELWRMTLPVIRDALSRSFPADQARFESRAAETDSALAALHKWVVNEVASVPEERRIMITAHDAFGYFGRAYGITVHGLQGVSTVAEYGINDVNRMVDLILAKRIRAVFVETSVPRRSIEAVVAGVRARDGEIRIGGSLYSDAMGPAGSMAGSYEGMVRANVRTIVEALK